MENNERTKTMADMKYFNKLTIKSTDPDIGVCAWNKADVLLEINELGLTSCYKDTTDWAKYIVTHALDEIEDYDESLTDMFFESSVATRLVLNTEVGEVEIVKE